MFCRGKGIFLPRMRSQNLLCLCWALITLPSLSLTKAEYTQVSNAYCGSYTGYGNVGNDLCADACDNTLGCVAYFRTSSYCWTCSALDWNPNANYFAYEKVLLQCSAGSGVYNEACEPCPIGTYQPNNEWPDPCKACPDTSTTLSSGVVLEDDCVCVAPAGKVEIAGWTLPGTATDLFSLVSLQEFGYGNVIKVNPDDCNILAIIQDGSTLRIFNVALDQSVVVSYDNPYTVDWKDGNTLWFLATNGNGNRAFESINGGGWNSWSTWDRGSIGNINPGVAMRFHPSKTFFVFAYYDSITSFDVVTYTMSHWVGVPGSFGYSNNGMNSQFNGIEGLDFTENGDGLYIADTGNERIRLWDQATQQMNDNCVACVTGLQHAWQIKFTPDYKYLIVPIGGYTNNQLYSIEMASGTIYQDLISNRKGSSLHAIKFIDVCAAATPPYVIVNEIDRGNNVASVRRVDLPLTFDCSGFGGCSANQYLSADYESQVPSVFLFSTGYFSWHDSIKFSPDCSMIAVTAAQLVIHDVASQTEYTIPIDSGVIDMFDWASNDVVYYINKASSSSVLLRKADKSTGSWVFTTLFTGLEFAKSSQRGLEVAPNGEFLVFTYSHSIQKYNIATNQMSTLIGSVDVSGTQDGAAASTRFNKPEGLIFTKDGSGLYISDTQNARIRYYDFATQTTTSSCTACIKFIDSGINFNPYQLVLTSDEKYLMVSGFNFANAPTYRGSQILTVELSTGTIHQNVVDFVLSGGTIATDTYMQLGADLCFAQQQADGSTLGVLAHVTKDAAGREIRSFQLAPACEACATGLESTAQSTSIDQCIAPGCGPGQAFNTDNVCQNCDAGTYQDESAYTGECKHCLEHSNNELYVHEGTTFPDRVGLFTSTQAGSDTCGDCVANAELSSGTCQCSAGYYRVYTLQDLAGPAVDRCDPCPVNTFKSAVGVVAGCVSDSSWTDGYDNCDAYENNILTTSDDWCGYSDTVYGDSRSHCCICTDYDPNDYDEVDPATMIWVQSQCTTCPANSYAATTANVDTTACKCNAGYTGPDGGPCVACEADTYKTESGDAACTPCAANSVSPAASTTEDACICDTGYELGTGCQACEAGHYKSVTGSAACTQCPADSVDVNAYYCICNAGYYLSAPDTCLQCAVGTWKFGTGNSTGGCTDCLDHMTTLNTKSTTIEDCLCNAGYYGNYDECQECAAGAYTDTIGKTTCTDCPVGSSSLTTTNDAESDCVADVGYEKLDGVYTQCQIGFYKNTIGNTLCIECLHGSTTSGTGSTQNTQCECVSPNYYGTAGDECFCADGYARWHEDDHNHATMRRLLSHEDCNLCEAGKYCPAETDSGGIQLLNSDTLPSCPENSNSPAGSSATTNCNCNAGYTGPDGGPCVQCGVGTYKDAAGSQGCTACAQHETSPMGSASLGACVCDAGYELGTNTELISSWTVMSSTYCDRNTAVNNFGSHGNYANALAACKQHCLNNAEAPYDSYFNEQCVGISVRTDRYDMCWMCRVDTYPPIHGSSANWDTYILTQETVTTSDCQACKAGHYKDIDGDLVCTSCADEHETTSGASVSADACVCTAGYSSEPNSQAFAYTTAAPGMFCADGERYYVNDDRSLIGCKQFCEGNLQQTCSQFEWYGIDAHRGADGNYVPTVNGACVLCHGTAKGLDGGVHGNSGLLYIKKITECVQCVAGKYKIDDVDTACDGNCPPDSTSPVGSDALADCVCNAGYTGPDGGGCTACEADEYKDVEGASACIDCPVNSQSLSASDELTDCFCNAGYSGSNGGLCTICPTDTYQDTPGSSICETCPENSQSPQGSVVADACLCSAGYEELAPDVCSTCPYGKFKTSASHDLCSPCRSHAYTVSDGSTLSAECLCNAGYYDNGGACEQCSSGTYKTGLGDEQCTSCPDNSDSPQGSSLEKQCICNAGYETSVSGASISCAACDPNFYEDSHVCVNCPSNSQSAALSTSISDCKCNQGYTGPDGGGCTACGTDKYKDSVGSSSCTSCEANMNSPTASTTSDACLCNAGFSRGFAESGSSTSPCQQCEQNTYCPPENTVTSTSVNVCPDNSNSPAGSEELTDCKCNQGYAGPDGQACQICDFNYYTDAIGSPGCLACPEYSTTTNQASISIDLCNCDQYYKRSGSGESTVCHRECGPGFEASDDESRCVGCRVSHYKPDYGDHDCTKCPGVSYSLVQNQTALNSCICPQGYVWNGTWCHQCPADTFNNRANQTGCFDCITDCEASQEVPLRRLLSIYEYSHDTLLDCRGGGSFFDENGVKQVNIAGSDESCKDYCDAHETCAGFGYDFVNLRCHFRIAPMPGVTYSTTMRDCYVKGDLIVVETASVESASHTTCPGLCVAPAGYRVNAAGNNVEPCPVNHYQDGSAANCTKCPSPETYSSEGGLTSVTECECRPGYTRVGDTCTACGTGTYKAESGDGPCISCGDNADTAGDASDSVLDCLCQPGYTQSGDQCVACVEGGTKHILSNVSCIQCPEHSTLHQDKLHHIDHCQCDPGYSGLGGDNPCVACGVGKFSVLHGNEMQCHDCPVHATTESIASKNESFCVCEQLYEPASSGGPWDGHDCISSCGPGFSGAGFACEKCAVGSFKSQRGGESCTPCTGVRSNSRPGSISDTNCSCAAGKFGVDSSKFVIIESVGGWSESGVKVVSGFTQPSSTFSEFTYDLLEGEAYRSVVLRPGGLDLAVLDWHIIVQIDNIVLFYCTFKDCPEEKEVLLSGFEGVLKVSGYVQQSGNLQLYTRKTLTLESSYSFWNDELQAQAEILVARKRNRAGDYLFINQDVFSDSECINCPPKLNCKQFI